MTKRICLCAPIALGLSLLLVLAFLSTSGAAPDGAKAGEAKKDESKGGGEGDCYKFVVPLESVMKVVESVFEKLPDKAKAGKFKEVKHESLFLAEMANLATHAKEHHGNKEFLGLADAMKASALKMAEAAEKKDEAGVKTLHAAVEKSCDSCHEKFRDN